MLKCSIFNGLCLNLTQTIDTNTLLTLYPMIISWYHLKLDTISDLTLHPMTLLPICTVHRCVHLHVCRWSIQILTKGNPSINSGGQSGGKCSFVPMCRIVELTSYCTTRHQSSRLMAYSFSRLPLVLLLELQSIPQPSTLIVCNLLYQLLAGERLVFPDE